MVFENGVKNIQAAAYNGARTAKINGFSFIMPVDKLNFVILEHKGL